MNNKILLPEIVVSSSELYYALFLHLLGLGLTILSSQASITFQKKKKNKQSKTKTKGIRIYESDCKWHSINVNFGMLA